MNQYTAYIEKDIESGMYIGSIPSIPGAHTCAESIGELHIRLKEVLALCLEEMDKSEIEALPTFAGLALIEEAH